VSISNTTGLVNELACAIIDSAIRQYEDFALAAALQVVAACAQGSYLLPDGRPLCLYQMVLAPASAGKGAYVGAVKDTLKRVFPRLLGAEPGSREGLRFILHEWNAKTLVIDEFQGFLEKLSDESNVHIRGVADDLKEIWPGVGNLLGIVTKTSSSPPLEQPKLGVFGVGTPTGVAKSMTGGVISDGLLSRFNIFHVEEIHKKRVSVPRFNPDPFRLRLLDLVNEGQNKNGDVTHDSWFERWRTGKTLDKHEPQALATRCLNIDPDAQELIRLQDEHWEQFLIADPNTASGSVYDRGASRGLQYAALHCLGRMSTTINLTDVQFGLNFAEVSINHTLRLIDEEAAESKEEKDCKKILKQLRKKPMNRRELMRASHLILANFNRAIDHLSESGQVRQTGEFYHCTDYT
jgi:hypothetical protein